MDVIVPARLLDGAQDVILDHGVAAAIGGPGVAEPAVGAGAEELGALEADTNVVPPAEAWGQAEDRLLAAAVAVEEDQQRVRIVGFVAGRQEGADGPAHRGANFRRVKAFLGPDVAPGEVGMRHVATCPRRRWYRRQGRWGRATADFRPLARTSFKLTGPSLVLREGGVNAARDGNR